ncbi:hypothetical protein GW17_00051166 [Ensete ventricosum]|nr:hypothetical protein GW17_00051166 [Ensete ventricosum]
MRLNHVELFYALVAAIGSESRRCLRGRGDHMHVVCMQRWLATARPPARAVDHGMATCKVRLAAARPPTRGGRPQGQQPARGDHPWARPAAANPTASRGGAADRRVGRPLAGRLPVVKGSRRLHKGSDGDNAVRVKRARASF